LNCRGICSVGPLYALDPARGVNTDGTADVGSAGIGCGVRNTIDASGTHCDPESAGLAIVAWGGRGRLRSAVASCSRRVATCVAGRSARWFSAEQWAGVAGSEGPSSWAPWTNRLIAGVSPSAERGRSLLPGCGSQVIVDRRRMNYRAPVRQPRRRRPHCSIPRCRPRRQVAIHFRPVCRAASSAASTPYRGEKGV
jgi:hypothetical protein